MLLTRPPLTSKEQAPYLFARLACIRHAASVHPEPGSNSPLNVSTNRDKTLIYSEKLTLTCTAKLLNYADHNADNTNLKFEIISCEDNRSKQTVSIIQNQSTPVNTSGRTLCYERYNEASAATTPVMIPARTSSG